MRATIHRRGCNESTTIGLKFKSLDVQIDSFGLTNDRGRTAPSCQQPTDLFLNVAARTRLDRLPFEKLGHQGVFLYAPRRVDCPTLRYPGGADALVGRKHRLTETYAWFLAVDPALSWKVAEDDAGPVFCSVEMAVTWGRYKGPDGYCSHWYRRDQWQRGHKYLTRLSDRCFSIGKGGGLRPAEILSLVLAGTNQGAGLYRGSPGIAKGGTNVHFWIGSASCRTCKAI